jgi:5-methylcytosine-specific restriction endonuclease McrA
VRAKWINDTEWADGRRAKQAAAKRAPIKVVKSENGPIVRYPYFNAVGRFCANCGRTILDRPGNKAPNAFCDRQCSGAWKSRELIGEKSSRYQGNAQTLVCAFCSNTFERNDCFVGHWKEKFCCIDHHHAWQKQNKRPNPNSPEFWPNARELERDIRRLADEGATYKEIRDATKLSAGQLKGFMRRLGITAKKHQWERKKGRDNSKWVERIDVQCSVCGKRMQRLPCLMDGREVFCGTKCMGLSRWKGGLTGYRGKTWKLQRALARKRDNDTCQMCGAFKGEKIDVHHIKPYRLYKSSAAANNLRNLVCLCRSCHLTVEGMTDTGNRNTWRNVYEANKKAGLSRYTKSRSVRRKQT